MINKPSILQPLFCFHCFFQSCVPCKAGVICLEGATTDDASPGNETANVTNSFPCPPGYYCPEGSLSPIPCIMGTYNPYEFGESLSSCFLCTYDHFTNLEVSTSHSKCT